MAIYVLYLSFKAMSIYPDLPSDKVMQQFIISETVQLFNLIPSDVVWMLAIALVTPIFILLVLYELGRLVVFIFKLVARKTIDDSKVDPLKIITWFIAVAFTINFALSIRL
jgi:hypothetical protein